MQTEQENVLGCKLNVLSVLLYSSHNSSKLALVMQQRRIKFTAVVPKGLGLHKQKPLVLI